jgi:hypothetical protein
MGAGVANAAGVGVGPVGAQQVILVIEAPGRTSLVGVEETERLRSACDYPFAAVLRIDRMPVDIRHNSKIDRAALGLWASDLLGGARG